MSYCYNDKYNPCAIIITVYVINPATGNRIGFFGKVDTGASKCVLPRKLFNQLGLKTHEEKESVKGFDGTSILVDVAFIDIEIEGTIFECKVYITDRKNDVLIGRDVLNSFILTLNGIDEVFSIDQYIE